jgi:hypothetical protein
VLLLFRFYPGSAAGNHLLGVGFEVFKAVTVNNAVFWDINTQFIPHRNTFRLRYRAQPVNAM